MIRKSERLALVAPASWLLAQLATLVSVASAALLLRMFHLQDPLAGCRLYGWNFVCWAICKECSCCWCSCCRPWLLSGSCPGCASARCRPRLPHTHDAGVGARRLVLADTLILAYIGFLGMIGLSLASAGVGSKHGTALRRRLLEQLAEPEIVLAVESASHEPASSRRRPSRPRRLRPLRSATTARAVTPAPPQRRINAEDPATGGYILALFRLSGDGQRDAVENVVQATTSSSIPARCASNGSKLLDDDAGPATDDVGPSPVHDRAPGVAPRSCR